MRRPRPLPDAESLVVPGYPPEWETWQTYGNTIYPLASFGLPGKDGTRKRVARFGARYRAANLFEEARFRVPEMAAATARGYSELLKFGLTFGAAEALLGILGIKPRDSGALCTPAERAACLAALRRIDAGNRIFQAVDVETKGGTIAKREMTEYLAGRDANPYALALAVRSAFFHSDLTPNIARADPTQVIDILRTLTDILKALMDREFGNRMRAFQALRAAQPRPAPEDDIPF